MASALAQKRKAMLLKREGRSAILRREGLANYGVAKAAEIAATTKAAAVSCNMSAKKCVPSTRTS
jgi:hypothetical protein